ncbi:complement component C6-like [Ciona intestinalis]
MKSLTLVFLLVLLCCMFDRNEAWGRRRRRRTPPPRVNCAVSGWSGWGPCSHSCGEGVMTRSRKITRHPMHGGSACPTALRGSAPCTVRPCPVFSCSWTAWGIWSECNSCSSERSRFRNVSVAAMFGGETCVGRDYQTDRGCPQNKPCQTTCPEGYFSCADGITCIKSNLRCNDDDDCTDNSDEVDCGSKITSPCADNQYSHIPNIGLAGAGFDITEGKVAGQILDNNRFNGRCILIRSGDHMTAFRKPANIQYYGFQVPFFQSFLDKF